MIRLPPESTSTATPFPYTTLFRSAVLARAKDVLARLEEGKAKTGGIAAGLDDLPLFAAIAAAPRQETKDAVRDAVQAIDADALSPREALDLLDRKSTRLNSSH